MIEQTLQELGLANVLTVSPDAGAMAVMARRFERGELSARDLCDWAHRSIGHDGDGSCQVFVELDDVFDTVEYYDDEDEESLERRTVEAVHAFLNARR
ncbi:hypothetical protein [Cellulomonas sp. NS3]|uniref:hypothetical protein n=1 Tax=Cellulomonas sp. NS3 TaxID=2973977 RepID=UPI002161D943|nr:hypothetical protein [Cellulomonas sp. NS3]